LSSFNLFKVSQVSWYCSTMSGDGSDTLDDFFAKKDKKKPKKTKSAFTPDDFNPSPVVEKIKKKKTKPKEKSEANQENQPEEAPQPIVPKPTPTEEKEAITKVEAAPIAEATPKPAPTVTSDAKPKEDDPEWNEFVEETVKDYSGLRIQKLKIEEEEVNEEEEIEYDEEGKAIVAPGSQVWKVPSPPKSTTPEPTTEVESTVTDDSKKSDAPGGAPQKYVPPSVRAAMKAAAAGGGSSSSSSSTRPGWRKNPKNAPDISNEEMFPTLGASLGGPGAKTAAKPNPWGTNRESPLNDRSIGQGDPPPQRTGKLITDVTLTNKWDALSRGAE